MNKTEFMNGCVQFAIIQKFNPKVPIESATAEVNIDSQSLVIVKKGSRHKEKDREESLATGGRTRVMRRRM